MANPGLYCDRPLWGQAPDPQPRPNSPTDPILELFAAETPQDGAPSGASTPSRNSPALPKRAPPRVKGVARREHAISQSGLAGRLAEKKLSPSAIGNAREQRSVNYMDRTKNRSAQTAAAVGNSTKCPERGRQFCAIWVLRLLNMGGRLRNGVVLIAIL